MNRTELSAAVRAEESSVLQLNETVINILQNEQCMILWKECQQQRLKSAEKPDLMGENAKSLDIFFLFAYNTIMNTWVHFVMRRKAVRIWL